MNEPISIIITGVGGQGIILASRVLSLAALKSGYAVKVSETHGMAQRGGSVVTHLRYGDSVSSPLISTGQADYLVGFEKLEAMRCLSFVREGGTMIVNDQEIAPLPVLLGKTSYPDVLSLQDGVPHLQLVAARKYAQDLGDSRAVNMVLIGCLAQRLDISEECWQAAIAECVRPNYQDLNQQAFLAGWNLVVEN